MGNLACIGPVNRSTNHGQLQLPIILQNSVTPHSARHCGASFRVGVEQEVRIGRTMCAVAQVPPYSKLMPIYARLVLALPYL